MIKYPVAFKTNRLFPHKPGSPLSPEDPGMPSTPASPFCPGVPGGPCMPPSPERQAQTHLSGAHLHICRVKHCVFSGRKIYTIPLTTLTRPTVKATFPFRPWESRYSFFTWSAWLTCARNPRIGIYLEIQQTWLTEWHK